MGRHDGWYAARVGGARRPGARQHPLLGPDLLGGAIFCLLADIEIRKHTSNAKSLQDALRAINRAGGTIEADWPLERVIEVGDKATQGKTLMELHSRMGSKPAAVDLPDLWKQLGVVRDNHHVTFDNRAPLASIRASIVA